ncbi:MAG: bifunctional demethylmenaquinone methyltransferase/2-methoxy-6-polyprenyl-1,4-benzoquinol methylase UbiE [Ostreibacterium sp.]
MTEQTHFGFTPVDKTKKQALVTNVFNSVASNYDIMNDVMSLGIHRFWKYYTILVADVRPNMQVLDLASGTCDLAIRMGKKLNGTGRLVASDINDNMLAIGRDRMTNNGLVKNIHFQLANAELLPFNDKTFDLITMAFGLRNVTNKDKALSEMYRVLKPGGKCLVLEFSKPTNGLLDKVYDFYSFNLLPTMGKIIAKDEQSYRYLAESIRMHPNQETLKSLFNGAGFKLTKYQNLSGGIVALHQGIKV